MNRFIILCCMLAMQISCTKEINYPIEFEGEKIVINSFISSTSTIQAKISKTAPPTGETIFQSILLDDASVIVYEDTNVFDTLAYKGNGIYLGRKLPQMNKKYAISVSKSKLITAFSNSQYIPEDFFMQVKDIRRNKIKPLNDDFSTLDLKIYLDDKVNEKNYYLVDAVIKVNGVSTSKFNLWLPNQSDFVSDPCKTDALVFSDDCFDGKNFEILVALETTSLDGEEAQEVEIIVKSITTDYYNYLVKNKPQPEGFEIPFSQPNFIYTNISNGYGVFGAYFEKRLNIQL